MRNSEGQDRNFQARLKFSSETENYKGDCVSFKPCPSFPWFLGFYQGKPDNYQGFSVPTEPSNPWKDRESTKITKEIPRFKFTKEIQKPKEKKDWEVSPKMGVSGGVSGAVVPKSVQRVSREGLGVCSTPF